MEPRMVASQTASSANDKRFALLIDADNVSAKYLKPILDELSKYGTVTYKRIYGDWTLSLHAKWKAALLENSITPIQQFGYTQGKNATDSAMIIDAMDILYTNSVEGFCIVSSDSDFTRLAARIRESGLTVIGMGEKKTPKPFRTACDVFTTLELLVGGRRRGKNANGADAGEVPEATATKEQIEQAVVDIITDNTNNGKATGLGEIGSRLQKRYPDFDVRSYGTNQMSKLLSDFSSVVMVKDGNNVAVELADGANAPSEKPASDAEAKPDGEEDGRDRHRTRRRRSRRTNNRTADATAESESAQEAEPEPEVELKSEPESDTKTKPRRRRSTKVKPQENAVEEQPAESAQDETLGGAETEEAVRAFALEQLRAAGPEGVAVGAITKEIKRRFKTFRVTSTGHRNMRLYLASLPGVQIENREDDRYVSLT